MRWAPSEGHVPRGFAGAVGDLEEVRLVLVTAEPGDPYPGEAYPSDQPAAVFAAAAAQVFNAFASGTDLYHRNLRYILNGCFPDLPFVEQMRRAWITDAVLCSAAREGGGVLRSVENECRSRYLEAQLLLFPNAMVVALGAKATHRLKGWPGLVSAFAVAPPGSNFAKARPSWDAVVAEYHARCAGHSDRSLEFPD